MSWPRAEEVAHQGLNEARSAIAQMRVNAVRDTGLGAALAKALERSGTTPESERNSRPMPTPRVLATNAPSRSFAWPKRRCTISKRHARASSVAATLRTLDGTHLELVINDNGVGFDAGASFPGHFGLVGLREQAQLIDADLQIHSACDRGTTVKISLRIAPELL